MNTIEYNNHTWNLVGIKTSEEVTKDFPAVGMMMDENNLEMLLLQRRARFNLAPIATIGSSSEETVAFRNKHTQEFVEDLNNVII